jgi:integrase
LGALIALLKYGVRQGWLEKNPISSDMIEKPKPIRKRPVRYFTAEEVKIIFNESPPHRADLWKFLYYTGARIGETSCLRVHCVGKDFIEFPAAITKTGERGMVPIAEKLRPILTRLCKNKDPQAFLFSDTATWMSESTERGKRFNKIRNDLQRFLKKHEIPHATVHDFRHTYASHLVQQGVPLRIVQELMRHKDIKQTMRYAHLSPEDTSRFINSLPI